MSRIILYIDIEGNCDPSDSEIIQLGAYLVRYELETNKIKYTSSFCKYVKPLRNPPNELAKRISGITAKETDTADTFPHVYDKFNKWIMRCLYAKPPRKYGDFNERFCNLTPCSFSNCDFIELKRHVQAYQLEETHWLTNGWADIRKLFAAARCNNNLYRLSLDNALVIAGAEERRKSQQHNALDDAKLCALLYPSVSDIFSKTDFWCNYTFTTSVIR